MFIALSSFHKLLIAFFSLSLFFYGALYSGQSNAKESLSSSRFTIIFFGDHGTGKEGQLQVAQSMTKTCKRISCDLAVGLGDNFYPDGVNSVFDPQWHQKFTKPYAGLTIPFWMTLGNHDYRELVQAQVDYTRLQDKWNMPARHYSVEGLPSWLHMYGLDTEAITEDQAFFAKKALCGKRGWKILFGHHPLFSNGWHGDQKDHQKILLPVIRECGVDMVWSGHDHHQEHISFESFQQVIQGAGAKLSRFRDLFLDKNPDDPTRGEQLFAETVLGYATAVFTRDTVEMSFYDEQGKVIYEWSDDRLN
jgi:hypothetical protein